MTLGAVVAGSALLQFFIDGWNPFQWAVDAGSPGTWIDWAFGPSRGAAAGFVVFMLGGLVTAGSYTAIYWGLTDESPFD